MPEPETPQPEVDLADELREMNELKQQPATDANVHPEDGDQSAADAVDPGAPAFDEEAAV